LKENLVGDEDRQYTFCNKIFAGWDFCISNDRAAELKQISLMYELQVSVPCEATVLRSDVDFMKSGTSQGFLGLTLVTAETF